jgi:hypothetical protein
MAAGVEEGADLVILTIPYHKDLFGTHPSDNKVARVWNLTLMAKKQPTALVDLL